MFYYTFHSNTAEAFSGKINIKGLAISPVVKWSLAECQLFCWQVNYDFQCFTSKSPIQSQKQSLEIEISINGHTDRHDKKWDAPMYSAVIEACSCRLWDRYPFTILLHQAGCQIKLPEHGKVLFHSIYFSLGCWYLSAGRLFGCL